MTDSFLVKGVAFKKTFSYAGFEQQPKSFDNPDILLLNVELELKSEKVCMCVCWYRVVQCVLCLTQTHAFVVVWEVLENSHVPHRRAVMYNPIQDLIPLSHKRMCLS